MYPLNFEPFGVYALLPHEYVLSPLLWSIYSTDMLVIQHTDIATYSDDTVLLLKDNSPLVVISRTSNNNLNKLSDWIKYRKMKENPQKSK